MTVCQGIGVRPTVVAFAALDQLALDQIVECLVDRVALPAELFRKPHKAHLAGPLGHMAMARQHRIDRHLAAPDVRIIEAIVLDNRVGVVILEGVEFIRDLAVEFDNLGCHFVGTRRLFLFLYMYH
jgi:hypothetical protein